MATVKATKDAIKALPGMTAMHADGEWRVTVNLYRLSERYPDKDTAWCEEKQEAMAYYTTDADDALATAQSMSKQWMEQGMNMEKNKQTGNDQAQEAQARERVYDIPNGYRDSAETMFRRLRHQGFTPEWDMGQRDGQHMMGITIPQNETSQLRLLQKSNPATWGNHPEVKAMLDKSQQEMAAASEIRRARLGALTPDQREFIEVLHQQSNDVLHVDAALDVNDKLHEMAAQHHRLAQISLSESGLSKAQERVQDQVEKEIVLLAQEIPGVLEPKFMYDPRGTTVGLMFESGAHNSLNGSYKVPLNPERMKELSKENFQAAIEALERADQERDATQYVVVTIENTANAAFADMGREAESARIIRTAADKLEDVFAPAQNEEFPLRDLNGNKVGQLQVVSGPEPKLPELPEGGVRIFIECNLESDAYREDPGSEAAKSLRDAANQIAEGGVAFPVYDTNGNIVGHGTTRDAPSLELNGVIDMSAALGDVYLAEDGYSGIADGEYRYVIPTNGFEPGYHQGEGDAWLVNAKGEKAPGWDVPQTVRETDIRELTATARQELRDVVEGRVSFDDFERKFGTDDLEP